jgi:hypothetical protein
MVLNNRKIRNRRGRPWRNLSKYPGICLPGVTKDTKEHRIFCVRVFALFLNLLRENKSYIFWDITPCSPLRVNRHYGGTCRLHLQDRRISQARNQRKGCGSACCLLHTGLILRSWRWRRYVPPKRRLTFNGLHGIISQKIVLFITTAVRTSNPTW